MSGRMLRWLLSLVHRPRAGAGSLVIVRHHRVYAERERPLYRLGVSERLLEAQVGFLARHGLVPLTVSEALERFAGGSRERLVAMSFDDGYADNVARALPILARHGARATFYLTAGLMEAREPAWWDVLEHALQRFHVAQATIGFGGSPLPLALGEASGRRRALRGLIARLRVPPAEQRTRLGRLREALGVTEATPCAFATWEEARRLVEAGMEVGAHTLTHPFLSLCDAAEQRREIEGARDLIESRLGIRPRGFAYPGGDYDRGTVAIVESLGFTHAVTTRAGDVASGDPRLELRRRGLGEGACLGPAGRFSARLTRAELDGAFDRLRAAAAEAS